MIFSLALGLILGELSFAQNDVSPVSTGITARHWRALLFLGLFFSRWLIGWRGESLRQCASLPENQSTVESLRATPKMLLGDGAASSLEPRCGTRANCSEN